MSGGWYLMHRGWMESPDFRPEPFTEREAFLWSIEQAAHGPHVQWFNGVQVAVGRGEFATSSRKLATAFGWGMKRARLFLSRMEKRGKWALRAAHQGAHVATILTVCNYERFQAPARARGAAEGAAEGEPRAHPGHTTEGTLKKGKEEKARKCAPPRAAPLPYLEALAAWGEAATACGWKPAKPTLGDKRRDRLRRCLEKEGLAGWREAIDRARRSELLCGPDPPGWFHFDFLILHDNLIKVKDGNYDRQFSGNQQRGAPSGWGAARAHNLTEGRSQG